MKQIFSGTSTASGQPIVLPQKNVQVIFSTYEIAPGAKLPVHKHPSARYAYVLAGNLDVTDAATGATHAYSAGDVIIEMIDTWHSGTNVGATPVRLLVVDQIEAGTSNTVLRPN